MDKCAYHDYSGTNFKLPYIFKAKNEYMFLKILLVIFVFDYRMENVRS